MNIQFDTSKSVNFTRYHLQRHEAKEMAVMKQKHACQLRIE